MPSILHITAHLGGGAGSVLSSVAVNAKQNGSPFTHEIMQLEPTDNTHYVKICQDNNITLYLVDEVNIEDKINSADIVQIEWWHHPLTMKFMHEYLSMIPCRLVIWSHISGCKYPYIPVGFVMLPVKFIFTSPNSYENPLWNEESRDQIRKISEVVVSSSGNYTGIISRTKKNSGFVIGYVGFLGYSKICPDFVRFCGAVDIPEALFTVVGDTSHGEALINDVKKAGMREKFRFTGYSADVGEELRNFDVFGYLLNSEHTGTAENALLEAMAAGIPPVVLNQSAEKYIVRDGYTGFIVNNSVEYRNALRYLYERPKDRIRIGNNASGYVRENFSINNTVKGLENIYENVLTFDKKLYDVKSVFGNNPYEWFKTCLGNSDKKSSNTDLILGPSKGSIHQYIEYFPKEERLKEHLLSILSISKEI